MLDSGAVRNVRPRKQLDRQATSISVLTAERSCPAELTEWGEILLGSQYLCSLGFATREAGYTMVWLDDDCTLLHGVTLGGTGKVRGDRHPKLGKRVVVGSNASVLGNIKVGHDCKIGAGAALMHDLPPRTTVVGHKGRVVTKKQITSKL